MDGWVTIGTKLDSKSFNRQIKLLKDNLDTLEQEYNTLKKAKPFDGQTEELAKINKKIIATKKEIASLEKQKKKLTNVKDLNAVSSSMSDIIKKAAKWALAIFGIRSAYNMIRNSISTISQYNEQFATDIEYIKYALAYTLEPIIRGIVYLVQTLLTYINYISQAWLGMNLFKSAKEFEKIKSSSAGVAKNAKEINKQLVGFDEMNILSDTSSGSGGGGGVITAPSFDLSGESILKDFDLDYFIEKGKEIARSIANGINDFFANFDFIKLAQNITKIISGIYSIATEFVTTVNWKQIGYSIAELLLHIDWGKIGLDIVKFVVAGMLAIGDFLIGVIDSIIDAFSDPKFLNDMLVSGARLIEGLILGMFSIIGKIGEVIWAIIKLVLSLFGIHSPSTVFAEIGENLMLGLIQGIQSLVQSVINVFKNMWNSIVSGASQAWEGIKSAFSSTATFFKNTFTTAWTAVKNVFSTGGKIFAGITDGIFNAFKVIVNALIDGINNVVAVPFNAVNTALKKIKSVEIVGIKPFNFISTISVPKIPKLAKGGIINMPGRGVPIGYGSAIGGEAGAEWVQPLTDSQSLDRVAEAIGGRITVPVTTIVKLDGRQIARYNAQNVERSKFATNS